MIDFVWILGILASILSAVIVVVLRNLSKTLSNFINEQREQNKLDNEFRRSMQRAEINRYFRIVVEQGNPVSPEELTHLENCYKAYHKNGGNGVGTIMYQRICEYAKLVTQVTDVEPK